MFPFSNKICKYTWNEESCFQKCSQVYLNLEQKRKCNKIYGENDNLQISTDNILTLKFTCE